MTRKILFIIFVTSVVIGIALLTVQGISKTDQTSGEKVVAQKGKYKIILKKVMKKEKEKEYLKTSDEGKPLIVSGTTQEPYKDSLEFYDDNGNLLKRYQHRHSWAMITQNEKYVIYSYTDEPPDEKGYNWEKAMVLNDKGELLWESNDIIWADSYWATDDGTIITPPGMYANLAFYKDGKLIKKFPSLGHTSVLSGNQKYVVIGGGSKLYLIDVVSGKILWEKNGKEDGIDGIDALGISYNGQFVGVTCGMVSSDFKKMLFRRFYLLDNLGNILYSQDIPLVGNYKIKFSKNEKYLLMTGEENEVYYFDVENKTMLWKYEEKNEHGLKTLFMDINVDESGDIIVLSGEVIMEMGLTEGYKDLERKIIWLNKKKEVIHRETIDRTEFQLWEESVPLIEYDSKKKRFKIEKPEQIESYEVNSLN